MTGVSTAPGDDVAQLIEQMRSGLASAAPIYQPGEFWNELIAANLRMLELDGIESFKRTLSNNYYNWLVTSPRDVQVRHVIGQLAAQAHARAAHEPPR